jgi:hypothetical protein
MALPLPLSAAPDLFVESFIGYDEVSTKTLGRWSVVVEADRTITGVIQTDKSKDVRLDEDGALSSGTLMLHTRETLSANDLSQDGQVLRQTYVRYMAEVWKLHRLTDWPVKTQGYNLYYLEKYTNIGGLP